MLSARAHLAAKAATAIFLFFFFFFLGLVKAD